MTNPAEEKGGCTCSHPPPSIVTTATNVLPPPCPVHNIILLPDIREQDAALRAEVAERGKDLEDAADSLFKAVARADKAEAEVERLTKERDESDEAVRIQREEIERLQRGTALAEMGALLDAAEAEVERLTPTDAEIVRAYCLADGHTHRNRYAEAICSLRFQCDKAEAEVERLTKGDEQRVHDITRLAMERDQQERFKWEANKRADKAEARVERLTTALREIAEQPCDLKCDLKDGSHFLDCVAVSDAVDIARRAVEEP